jgi:pilus assembly protein CpaF
MDHARRRVDPKEWLKMMLSRTQSQSQPQASVRLTEHDITLLVKFLGENLMRAMEAEGTPVAQQSNFIKQNIGRMFEKTQLILPDNLKRQIADQVINNLLGYGPIQVLLDDPDISEIMVNGPKKVFIEKNGQLTKSRVVFEDDAHVLRIIDRIILPLGRRVDADSPAVDARLPDGSRVNAVVRPVAIDGPSITIRKFRKDKLKVDDLIRFGSITRPMADFLQACVKAHLNIIISGGTGSGKTTLLNVMSGFIPENERIITIEDAAELQLQQDHVLRMETKTANIDGVGSVSIRDLVKNSLRMRPDRIIVGEVRGGEALDMLQAMNTGHDGSLTTIHANTPRDAISRLETLVLMAGMDLPLKVVRQQVSSAIDLIVQQSRLKDGQRKVIGITEVAGMEGDTVVLTDIFKFDQTGVAADGKVLGELIATGLRPNFSPRLESAGFKLGASVFATKSLGGTHNLRR